MPLVDVASKAMAILSSYCREAVIDDFLLRGTAPRPRTGLVLLGSPQALPSDVTSAGVALMAR